MKVNINGITREMTQEEIKVFEEENCLIENNNPESDISERVKRLEKEISDTSTEVTNLQEALCEVYEAII